METHRKTDYGKRKTEMVGIMDNHSNSSAILNLFD